ncbi:MAG: CDP-alcohol phosphatidyltransferase family protein [Chthoniobacterales bacterium]
MRKILIRADDSAGWVVAGLRQIDRILLALDEALTEPAKVWIVCDKQAVPADLCRTRKCSRLLLQTSELERPADLTLDTHLFFGRKSAALRTSLQNLPADLTASRPNEGGCEYLGDPSSIAACEERFLRGSGKPQDGLVSRFFNRPISRVVSRPLLRTPITPTAWTLGILILPLVGSGFLTRGNYFGIVLGMFFFQLYSIFDGCDGEIARAKYLESARGGKIDTWCDILGSLLMAISLGFGLSRHPDSNSFFLEGLLVAGLIFANEVVLATAPPVPLTTPSKGTEALYERHRRLLPSTGLLARRIAPWLIQMTKRDVALLGFLLLALVGWPGWILHLLGLVAAGSLLLALRSR